MRHAAPSDPAPRPACAEHPLRVSPEMPSKSSSYLLAAAIVLALVSALGTTLSLPGPAEAQPAQDGSPTTVTLAFFTPQLGFASPLERSGWCAAVGRQLAAAGGVEVEAKGFARAEDFRAYLGRRKLALAIVDAQLGLASGWQPLLQAVGEDGQAAPPMALVSRQYRSIPELKGKTLILASVGGGERALVHGLVLAGEVAPNKFFGRVETAPDAASAAAAVSLGKADASLLYLAQARSRGLEAIHVTEGVPLPLLVDVSKDFPEELRQRLVAGIAGAPGGGGVSGWKPADGGLLAQLASRLHPEAARVPVPAATPWLPLRDEAEKGGAAAGLPLELGPAVDLYEPGLPESRADFAPFGRPREEEEKEERPEPPGGARGGLEQLPPPAAGEEP